MPFGATSAWASTRLMTLTSLTTDGKKKYTLKDGLPKSMIGGNIQPGDLKYEDVNGDGIINNKDMVVLGKSGTSSQWVGTYGAPSTWVSTSRSSIRTGHSS